MMKLSTRKGFSFVEVALVVALLALGGFVGYKFIGAAMGHKAAQTTATVPVSSSAVIKSSKDLDTINKQLDTTDIAGSFEKDLNTASSF